LKHKAVIALKLYPAKLEAYATTIVAK